MNPQENTSHLRHKGIVKYVPQGKFYGFICKDNCDTNIFVHFSNVRETNPILVKNDLVEFEIIETVKGLKAINVNKIDLSEKRETIDQENAIASIRQLASVFNKASKREFTFLLLGRTGVGKSSTVNTLIGEDIAEVGDFLATTFNVKYYHSQIADVNYSIVDTPGLCDEHQEMSKDEFYLNQVKQKVKTLDCLWFTTPLIETRIRSDELHGIELITKVFGQTIWDRSVIVFTFADLVQPHLYSTTVNKRTELLREAIAKSIDKDIAMKIPSVAVSNKLDTTPDGKLWLGELYSKVFTRISNQGALPFFLATANRIVDADTKEEKKTENEKTIIDETNKKTFDSQKKQSKITNELPSQKQVNSAPISSHEKKPKKIILDNIQRIEINKHIESELKSEINAEIIKDLAATGMLIGTMFGGAIPAAIGGVIGAAIGSLVWLFRKK